MAPFSQYKRYTLRIAATAICIALWIAIGRTLIDAPSDFPIPYNLSIERGQTLFSVSQELQSDHIIRSRRTFEVIMILLGTERSMSEGEYSFSSPLSVFEVAFRISGKQFGIERVKVTFPEGFTTDQMADRLAATFPDFNTAVFKALSRVDEGYLFPDTYKFFPSVTPEIVVRTLKQNFETTIEPLQQDIAASGTSLHDIITMASLIEKEANGDDDREIISGILWKRIAQGMPLQVDAPFLFLLGKESKELTRTDLAIKSPYNTYINKGLPPTPINNPGISAIKAAIHPKDSPYLYYLHDASGQIHYARTYAEHKKNIATYLK